MIAYVFLETRKPDFLPSLNQQRGIMGICNKLPTTATTSVSITQTTLGAWHKPYLTRSRLRTKTFPGFQSRSRLKVPHESSACYIACNNMQQPTTTYKRESMPIRKSNSRARTLREVRIAEFPASFTNEIHNIEARGIFSTPSGREQPIPRTEKTSSSRKIQHPRQEQQYRIAAVGCRSCASIQAVLAC
ncbi:hypothetical protein Nepgr_033611 [Nepenthes gracilis]|uniref:Uncharacterized protein n=1 Tax=Nepenthes gracilis TaxID=150966 RepID=A0AAD3Y6R1_NEPGR|nr:hypothetical protein Nepgr_033611 [Nepenthes gracilis]